MTIKSGIRLAILLTTTALAGLSLTAGEISGKALDISQMGIPGVQVTLEDSQGNQTVIQTDATGSFHFPDLEEGYYLLFAEEPLGYELIKPPCGSYYDYVGPRDSLNRNFIYMKTIGIVLDFGTPGMGFSGLTMTGGVFSMSLFASGLSSMAPSYPTDLEIEGYWYTPGGGTLYVDNVSACPAGPYTGLSMSYGFNSMGSGYIELHASLGSPSTFNTDGELITFTFELDAYSESLLLANNGNLAFCMTNITFHHKDHAVDRRSDYFLGTVN